MSSKGANSGKKKNSRASRKAENLQAQKPANKQTQKTNKKVTAGKKKVTEKTKKEPAKKETATGKSKAVEKANEVVIAKEVADGKSKVPEKAKKEPAKKEVAKKEATAGKKKAVEKANEVVIAKEVADGKKKAPEKAKKEPTKKEPTKEESPKEETVQKAAPVSENKGIEKSDEKLNEKPAEYTYESEEEVIPISEVPVMKGYSNRKLMVSMCLFVAFALLYNMLIIPYRDARKAGPIITTESVATTEETTTVATTQAETTTETTTAEPTTQGPPVTAPTKKYVAKKTYVKPVVAEKKVLLNVPFVNQMPSYPTGCEAASATMLLRYYGYSISLDSMISYIPSKLLYKKNGKVYGPSIYEYFVGNPRNTYTSDSPGYGAFSPVVTSSINRFLAGHGNKQRAKNITGSSMSTLFSYLDQGKPLIVWATYNMNTPVTANHWLIETSSGDKYFEYPRGTHVTVLCGYDSRYVYIMDPYKRGLVKYRQSAFGDKYALLGKQAIVLLDYKEPTTTKVSTTETSTTTEVSTTGESTTIPEESTTLHEESTTTPESTSGSESTSAGGGTSTSAAASENAQSVSP